MLNFVYFTCHQRIIIIFKQELHLFLKQIFQKRSTHLITNWHYDWELNFKVLLPDSFFDTIPNQILIPIP